MHTTLFGNYIFCSVVSLLVCSLSFAYIKPPSHQEILECLEEGFDKGKTIEECHKNCKEHYLYCGAIWRSDEWPVKTCWQTCAFLADKGFLTLAD
jgi:hypothetical protein